VIAAHNLREFVRTAAGWLARQKDLAAYEIYAQSGEQIVARLNYTSDIPSRGVEETKSLDVGGIALRVVLARDPHCIGTAALASDFTLGALREALERARRAALVDPRFKSLPADSRRLAGTAATGGDLMRLRHLAVAGAAWQILRSALERFARAAMALPSAPGLIVGGDVTLTRERMALASSLMPEVRGDETAFFTSTITVLIEALGARAAASAAGRSRQELQRASSHQGAQAVGAALSGANAQRPPTCRYRVLLGPQPLAEILSYMVLPSLTASAFFRADSAYYGKLGELVMDPRIGLDDDPRTGAIRRALTCEGLPTARTELIRSGRLVGLLSNYYDAARLAAGDCGAAPELGAGRARIEPRHGMRLGGNGARRYDVAPRAMASNITLRGKRGVADSRMLRALGDGIHIGRVWYTYPINGQRAGDFTCTVSGDSYLVEKGRVVAPIAPNSLRINANIDQVFTQVREIGARRHPALVWGENGIFYLPAMVVEGLPLASVGEVSG